MFEELTPLAQAENFAVIAYGENASDTGDFRPGAQAAAEFQVRAPLKEAGLTKAEIRELSAQFGLPTADKPQMACLSSRIPYGEPVTPEKLRMIEQAEYALRDLGFHEVRVRHHELQNQNLGPHRAGAGGNSGAAGQWTDLSIVAEKLKADRLRARHARFARLPSWQHERGAGAKRARLILLVRRAVGVNAPSLAALIFAYSAIPGCLRRGSLFPGVQFCRPISELMLQLGHAGAQAFQRFAGLGGNGHAVFAMVARGVAALDRVFKFFAAGATGVRALAGCGLFPCQLSGRAFPGRERRRSRRRP